MQKNRTFFVLALYTLTIAALGVLGYLYSNYQSHDKMQTAGFTDPRYASDVAYVDLPRVNLNVASSGSGSHGHLRMDISLEVEKKNVARVEGFVPKITQHVADYARSLDLDNISQPEAVQQIRKYLVEEANSAGSPVPIMNVVFRQYLII